MPIASVPSVRSHKVRNGSPPLVMVTAYDAPSARIASEAGVDLILVGDSVAMVVLGYEDTLRVSTDDMVHHTAAVARVRPAPLIVADLPWMSYHLSVQNTLRNAARLIRAGAQAVKLEGGGKRADQVKALVDAEIPVMGHIGLTPQSLHAMGGFRVQARSEAAVAALVEDATELTAAGAFGLVLEGVPDAAAAYVTHAIEIPTIGIGAGPDCDGQVLVFHDLLGLEERVRPKFVRRYEELARRASAAMARYAADVRAHRFPGEAETYHASEELAETIALYGSKQSAG